jgi:hypothetical protein
MITDIPTPQEFERSSLSFLHLAWSIASRTLDELDCADLPSWDDDGSAGSAYLTEAQPELGNALALVLQAQEMSLKGRIAAISPYLIIARDPRDWPKRCENTDVSFAEFRSADAADLIRIHNTVSATRMPRDFADLFDRIRRRRNALVHTVSTNDRVHPQEVFRYVLQTVHHLHGGIHWPTEGIRYLSSSPLSVVQSHDFSYGVVLTEMRLCIETLNCKDALALLDFDKAAPAFFCPNCYEMKGEAEEFPPMAQLEGDLQITTRLKCFFCRSISEVVRRRCLDPNCTELVLISDRPNVGEFFCLECCEETDPNEAEAPEIE